MRTFREIALNEALKATKQFKEDSFFIKFPKDAILDAEDVFGADIIDDYDIDYNTNKAVIKFTKKVDKKLAGKILDNLLGESKGKEFFFDDDYAIIDDLEQYLKRKYKEDVDFELYIARGDDYSHGVKINNSKILKDKKAMGYIEDIEVDPDEMEY